MQQCCQNQVNLNVKLTTGQDPASDTRAINSRQKKGRRNESWGSMAHMYSSEPPLSQRGADVKSNISDAYWWGAARWPLPTLAEKSNENKNWNFSTDDGGGEVELPVFPPKGTGSNDYVEAYNGICVPPPPRRNRLITPTRILTKRASRPECVSHFCFFAEKRC